MHILDFSQRLIAASNKQVAITAEWSHNVMASHLASKDGFVLIASPCPSLSK